MELRGKRVVVVGFGKSGQAVTRLLLVKGAEVIVSEARPREALPPSFLASMEVQGVIFETGGHNPDTFKKADLIVISPGVPQSVVAPALKKGIPLLGELELAYQLLKTEERDNLIAITGTNGKTTTTAMVSELLKLAGFRVFTGGNYGIPLSEFVLSGIKVDKLVLEISSFQLETIVEFSPKIGLLLNITPDHLDRYNSMEEYAYFKYRLFEKQNNQDWAVLPLEEPFFRVFRELVRGKPLFFAENRKEQASAYLEGEEVVLSLEKEERYSLSSFKLLGVHNRLNLACALLVGRLAGADREACEKLIENFVGFPHRLEYVGTFGGVTFVNDSKATNVDATLQALKGLPGPLILILGGRHKGSSYAPLKELIREKVRILILMGEARYIILEELGGTVETYLEENLYSAMRKVFEIAIPGDIVLLSPACSSHDQFRDYHERGEVFRELVLKYAPKFLGNSMERGIYH